MLPTQMAETQTISTRDLPMVKLFVQRMGEVRNFLDQAALYRERSDGWPFLKSARSMVDQAITDLGHGHEG